MTRTLVVPGSIWYDALDPNATAMQKELGIPEPSERKQGRGVQFVYIDVTPVAARDLTGYLYERAELMLGQDIDSKSVFYTMRTTAAKLDAQLAKDGSPSSAS